MIWPLDRSAGGGCHLTAIVVGLAASALILFGGAPGTNWLVNQSSIIFQRNFGFYIGFCCCCSVFCWVFCVFVFVNCTAIFVSFWCRFQWCGDSQCICSTNEFHWINNFPLWNFGGVKQCECDCVILCVIVWFIIVCAFKSIWWKPQIKSNIIDRNVSFSIEMIKKCVECSENVMFFPPKCTKNHK